MVGIVGKKGACFDCGVEPTNHWMHYISEWFGCATASFSFFLARNSIARTLVLVLTWVMHRAKPYHYAFSYMLGIVRYLDAVDADTSDRGKLVWSAAKELGVEIQQITVYRRATEVFRVRFPKGYVGAGIGYDGSRKTQWIYFDQLPLVPWLDKAYTQWIDDKLVLKEFLREHHIPVPHVEGVGTLAFAKQAMQRLIYVGAPSVVVKPRLGSRSRHTTIGVSNDTEMEVAYRKSAVIAPYIVVEEQLMGYVCRATVLQGELVGFVRFSHPSIVGDGEKTIAELIVQKNERRNKRYQSELPSDNAELYNLEAHSYTLATVLPKDQELLLKQTAGWLYGGDDREMVNDVHPQLKKTLEKAAVLCNAQLIAFDLVIDDPESDPAPQKWGVIEANSVPYIEVHAEAMHGERVNVALKIWEMWREIPEWWR